MTPAFIHLTCYVKCVRARTANQADKGIIQFQRFNLEGGFVPAVPFAGRDARTPVKSPGRSYV